MRRGPIEVSVLVITNASDDDHAVAEDVASAARAVLRGAGGEMEYGTRWASPCPDLREPLLPDPADEPPWATSP
jgi:hypothetical protein